MKIQLMVQKSLPQTPLLLGKSVSTNKNPWGGLNPKIILTVLSHTWENFLGVAKKGQSLLTF